MNIFREGQGPSIVLSHALALDHRMWDDVAALLAQSYSVVRYDHRGHGGVFEGGPFSIEDLADDAAHVIRNLGEGPVVFAGLSLGGMVGQSLAARHPELLRGLVVLNSTAHYADSSLWHTRIEAVRSGGMSAVADGSIDRWLTPEFRTTPRGRAVETRLREALLQTDPQGYIWSCEAIAAMDLRAGHAQTRVPTLVVAGRRDLATPPSASDAMASSIPHARRADVDAAHVSAAEAPEQVAGTLDQWMRSLPPA